MIWQQEFEASSVSRIFYLALLSISALKTFECHGDGSCCETTAGLGAVEQCEGHLC